MPHKRSKRSIREAETAKKGTNLPPSAKAVNAAYDDTPKGASRIISGWKFQSSFRESGRTNSEDTGGSVPRSKAQSGTQSQAGSSSLKGKTKAEVGANADADGKVSGPGDKGKGKEKEKEKGKEQEKAKATLPKILPNESLGEYNRRIEHILRPGVNKAIKDAASTKALEESQARREKKDRKRQARLEKLVKDGKVPKEVLDRFLREQKEKRDGKKRKRVGGGNGGDDEDEEDEYGEGEGVDGVVGGEKRRPIKEFKQMEKPRRLNDIVQEPPQLPHLRKASTTTTTTTTPRASTTSSRAKERYGAVGKDSGKIPLNAGQKRILEEERERVVRMYREMKASREAGVIAGANGSASGEKV
ncbi:uncharacterized protein I303_102425 [Kwoniella dejecticola CBS 10117]|uniref:Uncharacterized protein n=1 Tax=Kwoniella dejecticola CBS 10117 TaxID=1296121 RepID=A0A1A6A8P9_9TREE|nr:uncharacterized protein I303_02440 [Kwoniella dejecticola CBS 10117]OBR86433.1 hypothetical protein I303_02440 [Kwoniella dejecticola CBS 10117]